jgi:aspartate racemase
MHIGLIGGIGPAATEFYYRNLVKRHADAGQKMDLTIVHADVSEVIANFKKDDRAAQAAIFIKFVKRLQSAGCDIVAITSMAGHFCVQELSALSPLPVLNAIPAINARFQRDGIKKIGLLGTNGVMASKLYGGINSTEVLVPQDNAFEKVSDDYFAIAGTGACTETQRAVFFDAGHEMINRGADAIMLAGTDLCLAFDGFTPGFPVIDSALVHVDAIYETSIGG